MSKAAKMIEVMNNEDVLYKEYEELLVRRDGLLRDAGSYLTAYTIEFGDMITANFELKIECIKKKKMISYCRRRLNRGLPIDTEHLQEAIEDEMKLYYVQLEEMVHDTEQAKKAKTVNEYRRQRAKKIYRRLAKLIHPDINAKTAENEKLMEIWNRVVEAYGMSDVDELEDLEVMTRMTLDDLGDDGFEIDLSDIEERIERVERQINDILNTEPYTYGELLRNEEKKKAFKETLLEEKRDYEVYLKSLKETFDAMLREGGVTLVWKMD